MRTSAGKPLLAVLALAALFSFALPAPTGFAQGVGINDTGAAADTSALLDLASTHKGLLPPRMTAAQRLAIVLPATGLVVYQTDGAAGLYYNVGAPLAPAWKLVADSGSLTGGPWSTSGSDIYYNSGNVSVGTTGIGARLTVEDPANALRVLTDAAGGALASFGGVGTFKVDSPGVPGGRFALLENGNLGLGRTTPVARLDVIGGNWDLVGTEGDFRVGDANFRLKMGIATSGSGSGAATIMEQGTAGQYNVLALGTQGNKVLYVNGNTQRIGVGTDAPNAPLGFPATLGKKITLYPGATGDAGIGVAGNRLQLYADNPSADVALGYDQAGTFNERFAVKPTGALAANGNVGAAGQVLQSNGAAAAATWVSPTNAVYTSSVQTVAVFATTLNSSSSETTISGLSTTVSLSGQAKLLITAQVPVFTPACGLCGGTTAACDLMIDGVLHNRSILDVGNGTASTFSFTYLFDAAPGSHTIAIAALAPVGNTTQYGANGTAQGVLDVLVIRQ